MKRNRSGISRKTLLIALRLSVGLLLIFTFSACTTPQEPADTISTPKSSAPAAAEPLPDTEPAESAVIAAGIPAEPTPVTTVVLPAVEPVPAKPDEAPVKAEQIEEPVIWPLYTSALETGARIYPLSRAFVNRSAILEVLALERPVEIPIAVIPPKPTLTITDEALFTEPGTGGYENDRAVNLETISIIKPLSGSDRDVSIAPFTDRAALPALSLNLQPDYSVIMIVLAAAAAILLILLVFAIRKLFRMRTSA